MFEAGAPVVGLEPPEQADPADLLSVAYQGTRGEQSVIQAQKREPTGPSHAGTLISETEKSVPAS